MEVFKEDIKCSKTLKLLRSLLKAGRVHFGNLTDNYFESITQGFKFCSVLGHIYFYSLDTFIENLKRNNEINRLYTREYNV